MVLNKWRDLRSKWQGKEARDEKREARATVIAA
jgi:hypothetical protein